jgi:hypothetical protein
LLAATFLDPRVKELHPFIRIPPDADKENIYTFVKTLMQEVASSTCGASDQPSSPEEVAEPVLAKQQPAKS